MSYTGKPEHNVIRSELLGGALDVFQWARSDDDLGELPLGDGLLRDGELGKQMAGYGINEIVQEAERMIREAELQADKIREDARRAAQREEERILQEALDRARQETAEREDPAREEALDDLRHAAQALIAAANAVQQQLAAKLEELEHSLASSAVDVAENVVGAAVSSDPSIVQRSVKDVLSRLSAGEVTLRLNPADLDIIRESLLELQAERSVGDIISFEADPKVERGGCIGAGDSGQVQSLPSAKLAQLRALAAE